MNNESMLRQRLFQAILDTGNQMVFDYDIQKGLFLTNSQLRKMYPLPGCGGGTLESFWINGLICPEDVQGFKALCQQAMQGKNGMGTFRFRALNNTYQWTKCRFICVKDEEENAYHIVGHIEDMIMKQKDNATKKEFFSRMSHEMRTSLNAIVGLNELAQKSIDDTKFVLECLQKADLASKHLMNLISDTLDLGKLGAGKIILHRKPFDLAYLLKTITIVYDMLAKETGVTLTLDFPPKYSNMVIGDELHLKQILINLISNAIIYNKEDGDVFFKLEEKPSDKEKHSCFRFTVSDTGYGIKEEDLESIFFAYERIELKEDKKSEGSGLGLAIAQQLAVLMGSIIEVESVPDIGSRFWVDIEMEIYPEDVVESIVMQEKKIEQKFGTVDLTGKRYLMFEDNDLNADVAAMILQEVNAKVDIAINGKIGCEMFAASKEGYYDAIIMDIRMPIMNGYEATQAIRKMKRKDSDILIVAMSANSFAEDAQRALMIGVDEYCTKPIISKRLFRILQENKKKN